MLVTVVIAAFLAARPARSNCLNTVLSDTDVARVFPQWTDWVLSPINPIAQQAASIHSRTHHDLQTERP